MIWHGFCFSCLWQNKGTVSKIYLMLKSDFIFFLCKQLWALKKKKKSFYPATTKAVVIHPAAESGYFGLGHIFQTHCFISRLIQQKKPQWETFCIYDQEPTLKAKKYSPNSFFTWIPFTEVTEQQILHLLNRNTLSSIQIYQWYRDLGGVQMKVILHCLDFVAKPVSTPKTSKKAPVLLKITLQACKKIHYLGHKAWSFSAYVLDSLAVQHA